MVLAAIEPSWLTGAQAGAQPQMKTFLVGIASGQTARLTLSNGGGERGYGVNWRFVDSAGVVLQDSGRTPIPIEPGQMLFFNLDADSLGRADQRVQLRVEVSSLGGPDTKISSALEVSDKVTGRTTTFSCSNNLLGAPIRRQRPCA